MNIFNMKIMRNHPMSCFFTFLYLRSGGGKRAFGEFAGLCRQRYPIREYALSAKEQKKLFYHYLYLRFKYGASMIDYFLYEFYRSSDFDVARYMTERQRVALYRYADDKDYLHICANKKDFYGVFSEWMQKECMFVEGEGDKPAFLAFVSGKKEIIAKPRDGQRGIGVAKLCVEGREAVEKAWEHCLKDKLLVEKVIEGCDELEAFHPLSLNTIRVSTAMTRAGDVHIMAATIRTGVDDNFVDNGHSHGVYAAIDVDTGVISTIGYNANGERFPAHPNTGVPFAGVQIPRWQELRELVVRAAKRVPQLRYVGWDWALDRDYRWVLVEGNEPGGIDVHQHPGFVGLYQKYHDVLHG